MATNPRGLSISQLGVVDFINCFSLLVVAGAVSTAYFFGQLFHAHLGYAFYWLLGSTIWIIYSFDHVLDGMKQGEESVSVRHYIHFRYRKIIVPTVSALAVFNLFVAYYFLTPKLLQFGLGLTALVILYFSLVHVVKRLKTSWFKELFVSVVVCCGMVVLPGISGDMDASFASLSLVACMILINYANLLLFSFYDYDSDIRNGLTSAATEWGKEKIKSVIMNVLASAFALFVFWTFSVTSKVKLPVSVVIMIMFNVLLLLYIQEERFQEKGRYRFWGDFIFLVPGLVWYVLVNKNFF
ncbi:MAG: hypothetical protein JJ975_13350 [Bacteroidia bacterium]|nr:hypothetical protein [Bacteroidia bacterium]